MSTKLAAYIITLLAIFAILQTIKLFRKDLLSTRLLFLWLLIWLFIGFFALFPSLLDSLRNFVNMGDRLFFITTGAILILFIFSFYTSSSISSTDKKIIKLTREIAILNYKIDKLIDDRNKKENESSPNST
jgi:hypothetical protein